MKRPQGPFLSNRRCNTSLGARFAVVLTDWLSVMAALGVAARHSASRTRTRNASAARSQVPSSRQLRKHHQTVPRSVGHHAPRYVATQHGRYAVDHFPQVRVRGYLRRFLAAARKLIQGNRILKSEVAVAPLSLGNRRNSPVDFVQIAQAGADSRKISLPVSGFKLECVFLGS